MAKRALFKNGRRVFLNGRAVFVNEGEQGECQCCGATVECAACIDGVGPPNWQIEIVGSVYAGTYFTTGGVYQVSGSSCTWRSLPISPGVTCSDLTANEIYITMSAGTAQCVIRDSVHAVSMAIWYKSIGTPGIPHNCLTEYDLTNTSGVPLITCPTYTGSVATIMPLSS